MTLRVEGGRVDPELGALASTAASTVVKALATTAWEQATKAVGALWKRAHPDRAETVEAEMTEAHEQLMTARDTDDDQIEADLVAAWRSRLRGLLATDPSLAGDLRRLMDRLESTSVDGRRLDVGRVDMRADVSGHGRAYQALGDQHITER
jgi:hypothetical protein